MIERDAADTQGPDPARDRLDNGLHAPAYVPLTDVDPDTGRRLLSALGRARIAAYLRPPTDPGGGAGAGEQHRLFVASDDHVDARGIVVATVRGWEHSGGPPAEADSAPDPLASQDTDAVFDALVADWHVDTVAAVRDAERDLSREDADWRARLNRPSAQDEAWLDEDHYVPPPPPPLPRLAAPTILALVVLVVSIVILAVGSSIGLVGSLNVVLGIGGLLAAAAILFSRLRDRRQDEEDDDGSTI